MPQQSLLLNKIENILNSDKMSDTAKSYSMLRVLAKHRSKGLANQLLKDDQREVRSGPFKGMKGPLEIAEGCFAPKILGTYEQDIHPILTNLERRAYDVIINPGCAEGYFTVGLARLFPAAQVYAYDLNPKARSACQRLAEENEVLAQIIIGEEFTPELFQDFAGKKCLVFCDIEGAEVELLDPSKAPALNTMDIMVETHDVFVKNCHQTISERLASSHKLIEISTGARNPGDFDELDDLEHLDQLLATWEWRLNGNAWIWAESRTFPSTAVSRSAQHMPPRQMDSPSTTQTAAIAFMSDGYRSESDKLMGRHAAGEGFLEGFFRHQSSTDLYCYAGSQKEADEFQQWATEINPEKNTSWIQPQNHQQLSRPGCLYLPASGINDQAWHRHRHGESRDYSICGVTHTTISDRTLHNFADLFVAPVQHWDAVICTSRCVRESVQHIFDAQDDYLSERFGKGKRTLPQLPIIPLGVDSQKFQHNPKARAEWRKQLNIGEDDVAFLFVGRLSFHAKANPWPMFVALQRAAEQCPGKKLHLILSGWFSNEHIERSFARAAAATCPSVTYHVVDGRDADTRWDIWSATDVFCSLADNYQETFGLVPVEAMAAGLPVVISDWDGYKDTVTHGEHGFRIHSLAANPGAGEAYMDQFATGQARYDIFCGVTSQLVNIDIHATTEAFTTLIKNPDLRTKMGQAGQAHAMSHFDWQAIIPQYEAMWSDLQSIRAGSSVPPSTSITHPWPSCGKSYSPPTHRRQASRIDTSDLLSCYASRCLEPYHRVHLEKTPPTDYQQILSHGFITYCSELLPEQSLIDATYQFISDHPSASVAEIYTHFPTDQKLDVERSLMLLAKYGICRIDHLKKVAIFIDKDATNGSFAHQIASSVGGDPAFDVAVYCETSDLSLPSSISHITTPVYPEMAEQLSGYYDLIIDAPDWLQCGEHCLQLPMSDILSHTSTAIPASPGYHSYLAHLYRDSQLANHIDRILHDHACARTT